MLRVGVAPAQPPSGSAGTPAPPCHVTVSLPGPAAAPNSTVVTGLDPFTITFLTKRQAGTVHPPHEPVPVVLPLRMVNVPATNSAQPQMSTGSVTAIWVTRVANLGPMALSYERISPNPV